MLSTRPACHAQKAFTFRDHKIRRLQPTRAAPETSQFLSAGPSERPPDYTSIDASPFNRSITHLFRQRMIAHIGSDSPLSGYDAIIDLTRKLNSMYASPEETQRATQKILGSLFPAGLLPAFRAMFSRPVPGFACQLNAWVTALTCQWLMGPCQVNDVEKPDGSILKAQGVHIERCRYLEESGCASICINSCKVPTQTFFAEEMELPLTMTPNYEDFSCQFSFGLEPPAAENDDAFKTPCFEQCPSKHRRKQHQCPSIPS